MMMNGKIKLPKSQISIIFMYEVCGNFDEIPSKNTYTTNMQDKATTMVASKWLVSIIKVIPDMIARHIVGTYVWNK